MLTLSIEESACCRVSQIARQAVDQLINTSGDNMQTHRLTATWPFQALADETRFRVIRVLSSYGGSCTASRLATAVGTPVAHLSRHLQLLQVSGLIRVDRRGSWHDIQINQQHPASDTICAAVLSMPDTEGLFAEDLKRLVNLPEHQNASDVHSTGSPFKFVSDEEGLDSFR